MNWDESYRYKQMVERSSFKKITGILLIAIAMLFISGTLSGCVSNKKYNEALDEIASLKVQDELDAYERTDTLYENNETITQLRSELIAKERAIDSLENAIDKLNESTLASEILRELDEGDWTIKNKQGRISVDLENEVLFNTGEVTLTSRGEKKIQKLANSFIKEGSEVHVWVVGHTDEKSFDGSGMDNWDLSSKRALTVTRALIDAGLKTTDVVAAARGQFDPEASNDKRVGRLLNRRTEILIIPKEEWNEAVAQFVTTL